MAAFTSTFIQSACFTLLFLTSDSLRAQSWRDWLRHSVTPNADLLLRSDNVYGLGARDDIHRARVWVRPGVDVAVARWLRAGTRGSFALSSDDNSDNIPRFDNFHSDDVSLDRLYLAVEKDRWEIIAGKFAMPFQMSEMIWDQDIQPRGVFLSYRLGPVTFRGAVFHRSHIHHDRSTEAGGQVALRLPLPTNWTVEADAGFLGFNALDQFQPGMERQNSVQLVEGAVRYQSAFELVIGHFRANYRGSTRWPLAMDFSFVQNFGAAETQRAIEVAAEVGKIQKRGDWRLSYSFQKVDRDAVVGAFTSDDWWFHSDHKGSRITAAVTLFSHTFLQFGAVFQERQGTSQFVKRFQFDLGARF